MRRRNREKIRKREIRQGARVLFGVSRQPLKNLVNEKAANAAGR
jgi:hypothetical protein